MAPGGSTSASATSSSRAGRSTISGATTPTPALQILADTSLAIPALTERLAARKAGDADLRELIEARTADMSRKSRALRDTWARDAKEDWGAGPIPLPRLASG